MNIEREMWHRRMELEHRSGLTKLADNVYDKARPLPTPPRATRAVECRLEPGCKPRTARLL